MNLFKIFCFVAIGFLSVECSEGELSQALEDSTAKSKDEECLADYQRMFTRRTSDNEVMPDDASTPKLNSSTETPEAQTNETPKDPSTNSTTKPIDLGSVLKKIVKHKITKKILEEVAKTSTVGKIFKGVVDIFSDDPMKEMKEEILNAIEKQTKILQESLIQVSEQVRDGKS